MLHNVVIDKEGVDHNLIAELPEPDINVPPINRESARSRRIALNIRNSFKDYFISEQGAVPWQDFITI